MRHLRFRRKRDLALVAARSLLARYDERLGWQQSLMLTRPEIAALLDRAENLRGNDLSAAERADHFNVELVHSVSERVRRQTAADYDTYPSLGAGDLVILARAVLACTAAA
jgi:hypothetical protein